MGFHVLWPLAFLVLVPVLILLYILKQEAKPHRFSSTMLWEEVYHNIEATKPWEKLKKNILLFLQILTVLLFILVLMNPWLKAFGVEKQQVILVVDNSASMDTVYKEGMSRLEAAKKAACTYVDRLPAGSAVHVISCNQQASLEVSNSKDRTAVKESIQKMEQTSLAGDLSASLSLVQSCASQSKDARIVFFTDTAFDLGDLDASVEAFYSQADNFSLDSLSYARKEGTLKVLVQAANHSDGPASREINLYGVDSQGEKELLDIGSINLSAGEESPVYFELDEKEVQGKIALYAEFQEKDTLAGDNTSWCVLEEEKTNRVLLLTKSNLFIEKAFTNLPGIELYRTSDPSLITQEEADLYIFDGMVPDELPASGSFLFIHCDAKDLFQHGGKVKGNMLTPVDSAVTSYIGSTAFGVNTSYVYDLPSWGEAFLKASNTEDSAGTAGFYGAYDGHRIAVLGFDLHQTDFGLQAEFPILISGLSDYLLDSGLTEKTAYTAGESVMFHGSTRGSALTLRMPDGSSRQMDALEASGTYLEVKTPGVYQVSQEVEGEQKEQSFSVSFPVKMESEVQSAQSMKQAEDGGKQLQSRLGTLEIRNYLLVVLLLLMLGEWIVYVKLQ